MSDNTIKGIGYIRVSTRCQGRAWSLPGQRTTIQEYAARTGIDLIAVYSDDETGTNLDRTQFSDALQRLRNGEASALVVYSLDRLSRNRSQLLLLADELQQRGIAIHLAKQGRVMGRTAGDRIADDQEARFAEVERAAFVERVANGRQAKIKRGHYPGGGQPPYGYRVEGRGPETQLVIDEGQASVVRMIFQLFAYGDAIGMVSASEIARRLTAQGLTTPADLRKGFATSKKRAYGEWVAQSIYPLLRNSVYVGRFTNQRYFKKDGKRHYRPIGQDVVPVPAIVDEATWHAVQQRLDTAHPHGPDRRVHQYLVAKRLKCACGYHLIGRPSASRRAQGPYLSYMCGVRNSNVRQCTLRPLFVPAVDAVVWAWMKKVVANPNARKAAHADHTAVQDARLAALDQERDQLYRQKVEHEQALSRLVDLYTRGSIPIELLDAKAVELRELLRLLQEAIEQNEHQRQTVASDERSTAIRALAAEHQSKIADAEQDFAVRRAQTGAPHASALSCDAGPSRAASPLAADRGAPGRPLRPTARSGRHARRP
jgi:DNA invertase Pin-like site-specific DNA recombinase